MNDGSWLSHCGTGENDTPHGNDEIYLLDKLMPLKFLAFFLLTLFLNQMLLLSILCDKNSIIQFNIIGDLCRLR